MIRRDISNDEFEAATERWGPKMTKFATNNIPFLGWDDKLQEARLVLLKCMERFDSTKGAVFHTYFHNALRNRGGVLAFRPLKHNEDPNITTYLGEIAEAIEDGPQFSKERAAMSQDFDTSPEFMLESYGFEGDEIPYLMGKVIHRLSLKDTAELFGLEIKALQRASKTAKEKMSNMRGDND